MIMPDDERTIQQLRHDLANPLGAILAEAQVLLRQENLPPEVIAAVTAIEAQALRARDVLLRLG